MTHHARSGLCKTMMYAMQGQRFAWVAMHGPDFARLEDVQNDRMTRNRQNDFRKLFLVNNWGYVNEVRGLQIFRSWI